MFDLRNHEAGDAIVQSVIGAAAAVHRDATHQSILASPHRFLFGRVVNAAAGLIVENLAIEVGTAHGLSAAVMALNGFAVHTWDVAPTPYGGHVWDRLGVREQIVHAMRWGEKKLSGGPYGLSFIDAVHDLEHVQADWAEVEPLLAPRSVAIFDDIRFTGEVLDWFIHLPGAIDCGRFGYVVRGGE